MTEQHTHRYGDHEDTGVLPAYPGTDSTDSTDSTATHPAGPPSGPGATPPEPGPGRARRGGAGILVAALLLGSAGGFAGAAGYDAVSSRSDQAETGATSTESPSAEPPASETRGTSADTPAPDGSAESVAASVLPSVVKINVAGATGGGSGSGIILSEDGEILTNNHVVEAAGPDGRISVNFNDGSGATATVVGTDPVTDLAVIQADDVSGLTPARIGDSDALDVGEGVVAIGSPFGLEATVTSGIVSSLNRPVTVGGGEQGADTTYPAIQTDAAINPGNSGGPLVDLAGEVVGVNSSIRTASSSLGGQGGSIGLGFAIPINKVLPIVDQLRAGETPTHARLGVTVSNSVNEDGLVTGAGIGEVEPGSAADDAGLQQGDIVTRVDDDAITGLESLVATIRGHRPGDEVTLTVVRGGETLTLTATLDSDAQSTDS
jgi:putative serine protease PepD